MLDLIISPQITEKATALSEFNKVVFKVHKNVGKNAIKKINFTLLTTEYRNLYRIFRSIEIDV